MTNERINLAFNQIANVQADRGRFIQIQKSCVTKLHNSLDELRDEICKAICYGLFQSSIALTNILTEAFLRLNVVIHESGATKMDDEAIKKIDKGFSGRKKTALGELIGEALHYNIIDQSQSDQLNRYREQFRNPYSHGSPHQLLQNAGKLAVFTTSLSSKSSFIKDDIQHVSISSIFQLGGLFQRAYASKDAIPYFNYIDGMIMEYYDIINSTQDEDS